MKRTKLFTRTRKEAPAEEVAKNAQLLIQAGYIYKVMPGVYAYTHLGLRTLEKIKQIVRDEQNAIDSQEIIMTSLQTKETWEQTGRWDDDAVDVWFKSELKDGTPVGFGWSHEEQILEMLSQHITSYRDLPVSVHQFQTKLRNELRAKSGIMRGREFVMNDMYSVHATEEDMDAYYERAMAMYQRIYDRLGIGQTTFVTFAGGGAFTKFSHEFQTICDAGEDILYTNSDHSVAVNEEVLHDAAQELGIDIEQLSPVKTAEVGNIFKFGTEKAQKMNITFTDMAGKQQPLYLASYGFGVTRVMGVIVEKLADDKGLVWPAHIAPYHVYLVSIGQQGAVVADAVYEQLTAEGIEVLYDDRDERPGTKFADAELMGIPYRLVISDRTATSGLHELTARTESDTELLNIDDIIKKLKI